MGSSKGSLANQTAHAGVHIGVAGGGGRGSLGPPLEKLVSLAGQKWELGRTEMGAWQDRNGSLAGQK